MLLLIKIITMTEMMVIMLMTMTAVILVIVAIIETLRFIDPTATTTFKKQ